MRRFPPGKPQGHSGFRGQVSSKGNERSNNIPRGTRADFQTIQSKAWTIYGHGRTMSVEYNPGPLLPTVRVDIHIEAIQGNTLILTYKCIPAVALLVQGAVKLIGDKVPAEIMKIDTSTRSIQVFLDGVEQLKDAFKYMKLQDIYLETDKIYADLLLK